MSEPSKVAAVKGWLEDRTGLVSALETCSSRCVAGGCSWHRVVPSTIVFLFCVQAITGFFLWMFYSPSSQTAWESVYYIQYEVAGGWLLRGIHHYSAQVLVALLGLYLVGLVVFGAYRRPREFVFWTVILMGLCAVGGCLTGDLLSWDQNAYASTQTRVSFLNLLPVIGGPLFRLAAGGPEFGNLTLTRFFALHVAAVGGGFILLLVLSCWFRRRAEQSESPYTAPGVYWPNQALRNMIGAVVAMAVVLFLVFLPGLSGDHADQAPADYLGVELGAPADLNPANFYAAARPEWSFRGLYGFSNMFSGTMKIIPIFIVPGIVMTFIFALPFIGLWRWGYLVNVAVVGLLLLGVVVLSYASWKHDWDDPDFLRDLAEGKLEGERAKELIEINGGAAPTGALAMMNTDPKTQGRRLFRQHCAACHSHDGGEDDPMAIRAEEVSAPNLYAFATRQQVAGFLNLEQIKSPHYFGNTKFKNGDMVGFVDENLSGLDEDEKKDIELAVMVLSAEARLPAQAAIDKADAETIKDEQGIISDLGCLDCHTFHGEGGTDAPLLTGYGSKKWLVGIISDPAHKQFYGEKNDRMPSYQKSLTPEQIEWLADWLRGDWPMPTAEAEAEPAE